MQINLRFIFRVVLSIALDDFIDDESLHESRGQTGCIVVVRARSTGVRPETQEYVQGRRRRWPANL
jgi:hypothetical protein